MDADLDLSPGIYFLLFRLDEEMEVTVGRLGELRFPQGWYGYVGSAMNGLAARVHRHLRPHDRPRWHLDYLLPYGVATAVVSSQTSSPLECPLAGLLGQDFPVTPRFGSSDCRCAGHLFHNDKYAPLPDAAVRGLTKLGAIPNITNLPNTPTELKACNKTHCRGCLERG